MTFEIVLVAAIGIVASYLTKFIKSKMPELGARESQAIVFATCFAAAIIVWLFQNYAPAELIAVIGGSFTAAIAYYEVVSKKR